MISAQMTINGSIGGISLRSTINRSANGQFAYDEDLPAAKTGTLTTRTDNDTGVVTAQAGHGIITNDIVDVYWSTGVRYGMTATVSGNAVTVDLGAGDVLPAQDTVVTITKRVNVAAVFDGDNMQAFGLLCAGKATLSFYDSTPTLLAAFRLAAGETYSWFYGNNVANPLTGNPVATIKASTGESSADKRCQISLLHDTTP